MNERTAKFVQFGNGGDTVEYGKGCYASGYGNPDNPHAADPKTHNIPDGTIALDKRAAIDTPEGLNWVFHGPMVGVDLADDAIERCPTPSPIMGEALKSDPNNQFGQLLTLAETAKRAEPDSPGPLDYVPISVYVRGWVERGARIGRYKDGIIVWEN